MQGRVYALTIEDAQATDTVVVGILPLFSAHAKVLFDPILRILLFLVHLLKIMTRAPNYLILSYRFLPLLVIL